MDIKNITAENYAQIRKEFAERNSNLVGIVLSPEEKKLDEALQKLKKEYKESVTGDVRYDKPIIKRPDAAESALYDFCFRLPKGSDLHVHGTTLLPARRLIDFVKGEEKLLIDAESKKLYLKNDANRPAGCISMNEALASGIDKEEIIKAWTVKSVKKGQNIWDFFENIFDIHAAIDEDPEVLKHYYLTAFKYYVESGIYHLEIHIMLTPDEKFCLDTLSTIRGAYYEVKREYPQLTVSMIGAGMKTDSIEDTVRTIQNTITAQEIVKDESITGEKHNFVLGFDLINEEDKSRPLMDYAELFIELKKTHPDFQLFLHCGESLDANSDNLIDAYILGARRVGHGMNLYRYPELLRQYADAEICLESCLISNQTLRYTKDLRLHPSAEYLKRGVTIALCSDDPIYQENEALTDDFFAAISCWDLGIAEVKQLCLNSIMYSGLDEPLRRALMRDWKKAWDSFCRQ